MTKLHKQYSLRSFAEREKDGQGLANPQGKDFNSTPNVMQTSKAIHIGTGEKQIVLNPNGGFAVGKTRHDFKDSYGSFALNEQIVISTVYETETRFTRTNEGTAAITFSTTGVRLVTGATASSYARCYMNITPTGTTIQDGLVYAGLVYARSLNASSGTGSFFVGLGNINPTGAGHDFTRNHLGFKIIKSSGVVSLYATQGDGTTEKASNALTTIADNDVLDLIFKVNKDYTVDYFFRTDSALTSLTDLSDPVKLQDNLPTETGNFVAATISNDNTAADFQIDVMAASLKR